MREDWSLKGLVLLLLFGYRGLARRRRWPDRLLGPRCGEYAVLVKVVQGQEWRMCRWDWWSSVAEDNDEAIGRAGDDGFEF